MAETNNVDNVSSTKGVEGGYIFAAPAGTALPTDIKTAKDTAFKCLGFLSEDGYTETAESDTEDFTDMNGTLMDTAKTGNVESGQFTLAEIMTDTLSFMYGSENVSTADGIITVKHNGNNDDVWSLILELVLKNGRRWRKVVPKVKLSELDDLTLAVGELAGRASTVKYLADESGNTCYDYYESTEA